MSLDVNISEPDEFNCNELHNCIESIAVIKEIGEFTYHVDILSGKGANYIANVFRVSIIETGTDKSVSVIVKTMVNTNRREMFRELHMREVRAYMSVIDNFIALQDEIAIEKRIVLPKYIFLSAEDNNEVIVLEDMLLNGFMIDSKVANNEKLDYKQVHLILTEIAKFHGLSFVLPQHEEDFISTQKDFEDIIFDENFLNKSKLQHYFIDSFQMSANLINNNDVKQKLEQRKDKIIDLLRKYTKPRKHNVFCHGDCWINNILFKEEVCTGTLYFLKLCVYFFL